MIKLIFVTFAAFVFFVSMASAQNGQPVQQNQKQKRAETITYDSEIEMTIAPCGNALDLMYFPYPKASLKAIAEKNNFRFVINGAYFYQSRGKAVPAGWYNDQGVVSGKLSKNKMLSHIVQYNTETKEFQFLPLRFFNPKRRYSVFEFQAGPMIIENNKVVTESLARLRGLRGQYTRTFLAVRDKRSAYFITIRTPVSLEEAAEHIMKAEIARKGSLTVISLGSGKGAAFYSANHPEYNYNSDDALPIIIGAKK
jgi:exopolysaccharide biosynthesis protein